MKNIDKILYDFLGPLAFNSAMNLTSSKKYVEANKKLDSLYAWLREGRPSRNASPNYNLLSALLYLRVGDIKGVCESCEAFAWQVDSENSNYLKKYADHDKKYLKYYCKYILEYAYQISQDVRAINLASSINVRFRDLEFNLVKELYRKDFPVNRPVASEL